MGNNGKYNSKNPKKRNDKNRKGKHIKEEIKNDIPDSKDKVSKGEKHLTNLTSLLLIIIIVLVIVGVIFLGIYFIKPEKSTDILNNSKVVKDYNKTLVDRENAKSILIDGTVASLKFINKKYKGNNYNISTGFFEREYDIVYFSFKNDVSKIDKLSKNSVISYEQYLDYCKSNNIKAKFNDASKKYSIFSNFSIGYENIDVFICDRQVENDTEIMYLSKKYSKSNPNSIAGFVIIYPSSQTNTTNTEIRDVISESDYYHLTGERMNITNTPINKDALFDKNIEITDDEKVNYILNKMLDNICHQNTIHYKYTCELPKYESVDAKLDLNTCIQYVEKNDGEKTNKQYTLYGDYEAVNFDENGFISNSWTYKDEIIEQFIDAESISDQGMFDFKLDEENDCYVVKAYVTKQNSVIEGKTSREEEFFYIDKNTFELKKMYCHNYISRYTLLFDYSKESINIPEEVL